MKNFSLIIVLFVFLFSAFHTSEIKAQSNIEQIESRDISLFLTPETPGTNETVTAELSSLLVDVNRMLITWFVDGEVVKSGFGETEISFSTGEQGEITSVEAYVQVDNSSAVRKWTRISPSDLDIMWEADTYTPPFYRGKALPSPESFIKIVGIPNVRNESSQKLENDMVFNWELNGKNLPEASGFGKNPLILRNDFLSREERIELEVIHKDGLTKAKSKILIPIVEPEVVVYEQKTYLRRANTALIDQTGERLIFSAEPYYFSTKRELLNLLRFNWFMNGKTILERTSDKKNELVANAPSKGTVTELGVRVEHPNKPLQETPVVNFNVIQ